MKLTFTERFALKGIFPELSSFEKKVLKESILKKIAITAEEIGEHQVTTDEEKGTIKWIDGEKEKDVKLIDNEKAYISSVLKKLDSEEKLHDLHMSLFEKFCK